MKLVTVAALFAISLVIGGMAFAAGSKCDSGVTKAAVKKVSCKGGVIAKAQAKGVAPDTAKLAACEGKFAKACSKAKSASDCIKQTEPCETIEDDVNGCVRAISEGSPSGAFLDRVSVF